MLDKSGIELEITREELKEAEAGITFFKGKLASKEIKKFKHSSIKMYIGVAQHLAANCCICDNNSLQLGKVCWFNGNLSISRWKNDGKNGPNYFEFQSDTGVTFALVTNQTYFNPGYNQLIELNDDITSELSVKVRILQKPIYNVENQDVTIACPYIILDAEV